MDIYLPLKGRESAGPEEFSWVLQNPRSLYFPAKSPVCHGSNSNSMAGWPIIADESAGDCGKTPPELSSAGSLVGLEAASERSNLAAESDKLRYWFDQFLSSFLRKFCALDGVWPLPPVLGDGQSVDLLKLFLVVREKGGYDSVSRNGLWDLVAKESGFGLNVTSSVKLVYTKYLGAVERWLERAVEERESRTKSSDSSMDLCGSFVELEPELNGLLSELKKRDDKFFSNDGDLSKGNFGAVAESDEGKKYVHDGGFMHIDTTKSLGEVGKPWDENEEKGAAVDLDGSQKYMNVDVNLSSDLIKCVVNSNPLDVGESPNDDEANSIVAELDGSKKSIGSHRDVLAPASVFYKEGTSRRKRKRESTWEMLNWLAKVAKNPCNVMIGSLPERSKWNSYGNGEFWKQILLFREAVVLKTPADSVGEKYTWQKNQRMHPCMYDDHVGSSYNLRERLSCIKNLLSGEVASKTSSFSNFQGDSDKSSSSCLAGKEKENDGISDTFTNSVFNYENIKKVPLGRGFQAEVPEWNGVASESDSQWLGTQVWPLEKGLNRFLIERDPIGKGRYDSCGCEIPGSIECVRFHIAEKKIRVKLELGSAFYHWNFDKVGEEVAYSWTEEEQKKFKALVQSPFTGQSFWDKIFKCFPTKSREELVSYYYNVFLLQRRACQNRSTPNDISSDDESGSGLATNDSQVAAVKSPSSIFHSPNKPYRRFR